MGREEKGKLPQGEKKRPRTSVFARLESTACRAGGRERICCSCPTAAPSHREPRGDALSFDLQHSSAGSCCPGLTARLAPQPRLQQLPAVPSASACQRLIPALKNITKACWCLSRKSPASLHTTKSSPVPVKTSKISTVLWQQGLPASRPRGDVSHSLTPLWEMFHDHFP